MAAIKWKKKQNPVKIVPIVGAKERRERISRALSSQVLIDTLDIFGGKIVGVKIL